MYLKNRLMITMGVFWVCAVFLVSLQLLKPSYNDSVTPPYDTTEEILNE